MASTTRVSVRQAAAKLAEHGVEAAEAYGRPDLAARLRDLRRLAAEPTVRVLVAGEFKQGKSSLVNALAGTDVCPIDDDVATSVATAVRYAEAPEAFAVFAGAEGAPERRPIDAAALPSWVTETGEDAASDGLQLVEVGVPADPLRGGLVLVDLPGAGGLGSFHGAATLAALRHAHGVLFVSDAVQELTATERDFLAAVSARCPTVALVKSKVDIHPAWRRILERDREHAAELAALVTGVSSELAAKGRESDDAELVAESSVPELVAWLRDDVLARAGNRLGTTVAVEVGGVCEQLRAPFDAERAALEDGANRAELEHQLEAARVDADRLRAAASRWQQVLSDAFTDIGSDVDHELRARVRDLVRRNEEAIDGFDPASAWEQYEPVLRREMASLIADHYAGLHDRVTDAAQRATEVFEEDAAAIDQVMQGLSSPPTDPTAAASAPDLSSPTELSTVKRMRLGGQALALARGAYGPALMLGFIGGIAGLTIAAPALLAVGLVAGGKGLRTEKQRRLAARQAQAKAAARKFVDDVVFQVGKDSRDEVRRAQRTLRDHFTARADELVRSANASLKAAQDATGGDAQARARRRHDIDAELERIAWLTKTAASMHAAVEATGA
ncbi:MAG: dynamin family protein [Actinomycetota bacterium]